MIRDARSGHPRGWPALAGVVLGALAVLLNLAARPLPEVPGFPLVDAAFCSSANAERTPGQHAPDAHAGCDLCCPQAGSAPPVAATAPRPTLEPSRQAVDASGAGNTRPAIRWAQARPRAPPGA